MNRNKVVSLGSSPGLPVKASGGHISEVGRVLVGYPIGTGWGYVWDGIYQESDFNTDGTLKEGIPSFAAYAPKPGDLKFKDIAGNDGIVDPQNDKTVISNSEPNHFGGFNNVFNYKNVDLSAFFQWSYGNDIMYIGRYRYEGYEGHNNVTKEYWENRWTPENPTNKFPAIDGSGKVESSSYYVEDGSYLRLKNITLGYNLPNLVCEKMNVESLRLYVSGENLATWTNYSGYDPEVSYSNKLIPGLDYTTYPRSRSFTFGLSIQY
jgi:hypothetical protein